MKEKVAISVFLLVAFLVHAPFLFYLAGDAQVHLAVAERFAEGQPFRFNKSGELVNASTSPFWTMMLTFFFLVSKHYAPLLLKVVVAAFWIATSYLVYKIALDFFELRKFVLYSLMGIWLTNVALIANALGGLENILTCLQLLGLYILSVKYLRYSTGRHIVVVGLFVGWMILTRPEGGFLGMVVVLIFFVAKFFMKSENTMRRRVLILLKNLALTAFSSILIILPWYVFQYLITGSLITDSSVARLFAGRRDSFEIIRGVLYFHPKASITLATVFFPISVGSFISMTSLFSRFRFRRFWWRNFSDVAPIYHEIVSMTLILIGVLFYSFIIGADHFGRYFLPIFPFFFLLGFKGLQRLNEMMPAKHMLASKVFMTMAVVYLFLGSSLDYYRRVGTGEHFSSNLFKTISAPALRKENTDNLLHKLGVPSAEKIKFAVTEVQQRYFFDDRIIILSLDGRSSSNIMNYVDKNTGIPNFEQYFAYEKPDFVELGQWCSSGGWLARVFSQTRPQNLICTWENEVRQMQLGDRFYWNGHQVTYVCPHIVRIIWP